MLHHAALGEALAELLLGIRLKLREYDLVPVPPLKKTRQTQLGQYPLHLFSFVCIELAFDDEVDEPSIQRRFALSPNPGGAESLAASR
jgi:hypothetical protein